MKITLDFKRPNDEKGNPFPGLPKCEVMAFDGDSWNVGYLMQIGSAVMLVKPDNQILQISVKWFAPMPGIIEEIEGFETQN